MMVYRCAIFAVFLIILRSIAGADVLGNCWRFPRGEEKPTIAGEKWYCLPGYKNDEYCLKFYCPPTNCTNPMKSLTPPESTCPYCIGTCSYGGKIYNVGDHFRCLDRSNACGCTTNNRISSSRVASRYQYMCSVEKVISK